jgi:dual specificity MAP kinase phosphatase
MAYLMQREGLTMTEAYRLLKGRRHIVSPNLGFMGQLLEFERHLEAGVGRN